MFRFALGNLLSRPLRSALSMLGLAVAIGGMVGLFSIAGGVDSLVRKTFEQIPGLVVQQRGAPVPLFSTLPADWGAEIASLPGVGVVDAEIATRLNVINGKTIISPPRFLVGMDVAARERLKRSVYRENMVAGRFLDRSDEGRHHCVISELIADEFETSVGDIITLHRYDFTVVGIYRTGSIMLDINVIVDLPNCRSITRFAPDSVNCYYVEPDGTIDAKTLQRTIEAHFAGRELDAWRPAALGLAGSDAPPLSEFFKSLDGTIKGQPDSTTVSHPAPSTREETAEREPPRADADSPVEVRSAEDWSERFDEFSGELDIFLMLITGIGVLVAVLSIVNTMMMSVAERTIEFGILRANGWSKRHILQLMTLESSLLGIVGGACGVLAGWLATQGLNWSFPERLHLYAGPGLLGFGILFSTLLGVVGGLYPAWVAARMSPMESIRRG